MSLKSIQYASNLEELLRPYNTGLVPHNHNLASIVLYTNEEQDYDLFRDHTKEYDYFDNLNEYVSQLETAAITQGGNIQPDNISSGKVPIINLDNNPSHVKNSPSRPYYGVFNNFSLIKVTEQFGEIIKVQQNFTEGWNAFFFGEKPIIFSFNGIFLDSKDYPYYQEFMIAYGKYLAGRKCVENKMQMKIIFDGKIVDGYMISIMTSSDAQNELIKSFEFSVLVRNVKWVRMNLIKVKSGNGDDIRYQEELNGLTNQYRYIDPSFVDKLNMVDPVGNKNIQYPGNVNAINDTGSIA